MIAALIVGFISGYGVGRDVNAEHAAQVNARIAEDNRLAAIHNQRLEFQSSKT
jgi:hypothetical protein